MKLEVFMTIPGYENYKISSKGRVWSTMSNKFMKQRINTKGYYVVSIKQKNPEVHRLIAKTFLFFEDDKKDQVDHIDRNKKNNDLLNLRYVSRSENMRNTGVWKTNTSGYKGVSCEKGKYRASITVNGKKKHLGYFNNKDDANEAYCNYLAEITGV